MLSDEELARYQMVPVVRDEIMRARAEVAALRERLADLRHEAVEEIETEQRRGDEIQRRLEAAEQRLATVTPIVERMANAPTPTDDVDQYCIYPGCGWRSRDYYAEAKHTDECPITQARAWLASGPVVPEV